MNPSIKKLYETRGVGRTVTITLTMEEAEAVVSVVSRAVEHDDELRSGANDAVYEAVDQAQHKISQALLRAGWDPENPAFSGYPKDMPGE